MKSWKTNIGAALIALGFALSRIEGPQWLSLTADILMPAGAFIAALFARDNDKTSGDVGAE